MRHETTSYFCDKCGRKLKTSSNFIDIVTSLSESLSWSRLHVVITHKHGMHNNGKEDKAELCKACTVELLTDALSRVRNGERLSAGVEHSEKSTWE